jgi:hypothetical protein
MPRRSYDPLACIPSPDAIRQKLDETLTLAERLRVLLDLAERLRLPLGTAASLPSPADRKGASDAR